MTSISSSYLPEAADSRLVPLNVVDTPEAWAHRLRLRLHVAARLIFNQPIFICEGWSLDSTSFLIVAGEILDAIDQLSRRAKRPAGIDLYSPFRIGLTRSSTYLTTYGDYLARDDCYWSGNPVFRNNADVRGQLCEALRKIEQDPVDAVRIENLFQKHVANKQVSHAIGLVAQYTSNAPALRIKRGEIGPDSYLQTVGPLFAEVGRCVRDLGHGVWHQEMLSVLELLRKDASKMTSSSVVMTGAREILSHDFYPAVEHVSRLAYMDVHSRHEGASFSAPTLDDRAPEVLRAVDGHLARQRAGLPGALKFNLDRGSEDDLLKQLDKVDDWTPLWANIVALALLPEWQRAIHDIRVEAASKPLDALLSEGAFSKLEKMLSAHCPDLVLKQSVGDRWGLGFKFRGRRVLPKGTDGAVDTLVQTALLTLPLWFFVAPAAAGAAAVAWVVADKLTDKSLPKMMGPLSLSRETIGSSLFRLFRN